VDGLLGGRPQYSVHVGVDDLDDFSRCPGSGGQGGALRVTHDLTQEEIAQLVGASRETVNKALADFAHRGWIRLEGKSVLISDSERLARRAR